MKRLETTPFTPGLKPGAPWPGTVVVVLFNSLLHHDSNSKLVGVFTDLNSAAAGVRERYGALNGLDELELDASGYPWYVDVPNLPNDDRGCLEFYFVCLNALLP